MTTSPLKTKVVQNRLSETCVVNRKNKRTESKRRIRLGNMSSRRIMSSLISLSLLVLLQINFSHATGMYLQIINE